MTDDISRGRLTHKKYSDGTEIAVKHGPRRRPANTGKPVYVMIHLDAAVLAPLALSTTQVAILNMILTDYRQDEPYAIGLRVTDIAERLTLTRQAAHRAVKDLMDRNFLYRPDSSTWVVNPHYGWRGSKVKWAAQLEIAEEPEWGLS